MAWRVLLHKSLMDIIKALNAQRDTLTTAMYSAVYCVGLAVSAVICIAQHSYIPLFVFAVMGVVGASPIPISED